MDIPFPTNEQLRNFTNKIQPPELNHTKEDCLLWLGAKDQSGYGFVTLNGKSHRVHRVAFTWFRGPIINNLQVHHTCANKSCLKPSHLELISRALHTTLERTGGKYTASNLCRRGHELTPVNSIYRYDKRHESMQRQCRVCNNLWQKENYRKKKGV